MRVLINYLYQYYPYTTASYLEMELRKDPKLRPFRIGEDRVPCADLIINVEPCGEIITYPTAVSCYWEIDNHMHVGRDIDKYKKVDHLFITQKAWQKYYYEVETTILPNAAYPDLHHLYKDEPLLYDVGFLGNANYPERRGLLEKIAGKYKILWSNSQPGEEYARMLSRCKILFNDSMDNDINMRFFEAMSIGRLLLTDKVEGQDDVANDGEHYLTYDSWEDLDKKIAYYLEHEKEREAIANAGAAWVHATQSYRNRLEKIMEVCGFY